MDYGITIPGTADSWRLAVHAERRGFHSVRFWDSPLVAGDVFVHAGAAAAHTDRIRIGTGVYVPWTREPSVTASAFASLNTLAPGRIELCAGTGRTSRRTHGLRAHPLSEFGDHMRAVMAMLRGDSSVAAESAQGVRLLHPGVTFDVASPVGVTIAAAGPRIQALTAELGAGWADILPPSETGVPPALVRMRAAWAAANRPPADLRTTYFLAYGGLLDHAETADSPRIRATAGPWATAELHYWVDETTLQGKPLPDFLSPIMREAVAAYAPIMEELQRGSNPVLALQEGHGLYVRPEEERLLSPELLHATSCIWSRDELRERMSVLDDAGVNEVCFSIPPGSVEDVDRLADALGLAAA
jgi:5,10-methylenetetrahydromethanopterin reductase